MQNKIYDGLVFELNRMEKILSTYCREHCTPGEGRVISAHFKLLKDYCAELTKPVVPIIEPKAETKKKITPQVIDG